MSRSACDACLRKSALIGHLGPRLSALLGEFDKRVGSVLALGEEELIAAIAGRHAPDARRFLAEFGRRATRRALTDAGVEATCRHDDTYPAGLRELADVPPVIYSTGGGERLRRLLDAPVATVVGTRSPSPYATEVAHALGRGLAAAGVTVVSGLALGIDAVAHRGALAAGGKPLGVLAGGVDVPYPMRNHALHAQVEAAGVLVSELPPAHRPQRWSFPARNRIMAALGRLTVVVEAAESSGTLITAEFAAQLGRDLGAVPGRVTAQGAAGSNRLLREGAAVIRSPQDALDELLGVGAIAGVGAEGRARALSLPHGPARADRSTTSEEEAVGALGFERAAEPSPLGVAGAGVQAGAAVPPLDATLRQVLDLVEKEQTVSAISRETGLSPGRARAALGRLESMGMVAREGFASYVRTMEGRPSTPMLADSLSLEPRP